MSIFWPRPGDIVVPDPELNYVLTTDNVGKFRVVIGSIKAGTVAVVVALARSIDSPIRDRFVLLLYEGRLGWAYEQQVRRAGPPEKAHAQ